MLLQLMVAAPPQDEARLHREARQAQSRFEGIRRMHLPRPRGFSSGGSGRCDARIGRYCYWYDPHERPPVPEPQRIVDARSSLIGFLDSAAAQNPGDGWIAGQRVRYLVEAGRLDDALEAARACRAEEWWCHALEGLALHVGKRAADAEASYERALDAMPAVTRCEWTDLRLLLADRPAREHGTLGCEDRERSARRIWWLAQPLWMTAGNDLRTEHFTRLTMAQVMSRSANAHGMSWGNDSRELLLRYGWSEWFTRHEYGSGINASSSVTGHDREPSFHFLPRVESLDELSRIPAEAWSFEEPLARTRYAPRHLEGFSALVHQLARFPRGDSMLVGVAFAVSDTALARDDLSAALIFGTQSRTTRKRVQTRLAEARGATSTIWLTVPRDTGVVSVEVRGQRSNRAARARYSVDPLPRGGWTLSDLLLFDAGALERPRVAQEALGAALAEPVHRASRPLGVYWEAAGRAEAPVWISVVVEKNERSLVRRLATRLGLADEPAPVRLRWQTRVSESPHGESVAIRLPENARGRHLITLNIQPASGRTLSAEREIVVQ